MLIVALSTAGTVLAEVSPISNLGFVVAVLAATSFMVCVSPVTALFALATELTKGLLNEVSVQNHCLFRSCSDSGEALLQSGSCHNRDSLLYGGPSAGQGQPTVSLKVDCCINVPSHFDTRARGMFSCILIGSPRLHRWQWPWASLLPKNCQVPPAVLGSQGRTSSLRFGASSFLGSQPRKRAKRHTDMSTSVALEMVVRQLTSAMYCHHRPGGLKVANKTCVKCWRH